MARSAIRIAVGLALIAVASLPSSAGAQRILDPPHASIVVDPSLGDSPCAACHGPQVAGLPRNQVCAQCHGELPTLETATLALTHGSAVTGTARFQYELECVACHNPHDQEQDLRWGTAYGKYVMTEISESIFVTDQTVSPPESLVKGVWFFPRFTSELQLATGNDPAVDPVNNWAKDVCSGCHTLTNHHQNDGTAPGGQDHYSGTNCTVCHSHENGFGIGFAGGDHPQSTQTECGSCHGDPVSGEIDLPTVHANRCTTCHPGGFGETILGPLGTWDLECAACHQPGVTETGGVDEPTVGHRCVVCHGEQRSLFALEEMHRTHSDRASCAVCHGFIPDVGTEIGSGNRQICALCHEGGRNASIEAIHKRHADPGLSCLECHGDVRPPIDVVFGPVGQRDHVCQICHRSERPSDFQTRFEELHRRHTARRLDCGSCHLDAILQDDRVPMPAHDDPVRASVSRSGDGECFHCHEAGESGSVQLVHGEHVEGQWQWCYNCHEGSDEAPMGLGGPVTEPAASCDLCHTGRSYNDAEPFGIHEIHSGASVGGSTNKCYACHQTVAQIFDWPREWLNAGPGSTPVDSDDDGVPDDADGDPATSNPCSCDAPDSPTGCAQGCDDNCPGRANPDQLDRGGVQSFQYRPGDGGPDAIGDACQCGDMNGDGTVNGTDVVLYRRRFAGQTSPFSTDRCSVGGADGTCDSSDVVVIRRTFGGQTDGILTQSCSAALGLPDPGVP